MAQKRCIHCSMMMNDNDIVCPSCHKSQMADSYVPEKESLYTKFLKSNLLKAIVIVGIIFLFIASCNAS